MLEKYKTVYEGGEGEIVEKKSRFIATVRPDRRGGTGLYRGNEEEILGCQT